MENKDNNAVVCFGELLWDVLPTAKRPGGAPMNVAYHLQKLNIHSHLISSIGDDDLGRSMLSFIERMRLPKEGIQMHNSQPTSEVIATITEENEVLYDIVYPVAWDFIGWKPDYDSLLKNSTALVYGSLASRSEVSAKTLLKMLEYETFKIFDVNLRFPHYNPEVIDRLLRAANLLKLNAAELELISSWYRGDLNNESDRINHLFDAFNVEEILITKGAAGASYYNRKEMLTSSSFKIQVNDTIGSGDSFLAAFLSQKLQHQDPATSLEYAVAMGAFITSKPGGCPSYEKAEFETFLTNQRAEGKH